MYFPFFFFRVLYSRFPSFWHTFSQRNWRSLSSFEMLEDSGARFSLNFLSLKVFSVLRIQVFLICDELLLLFFSFDFLSLMLLPSVNFYLLKLSGFTFLNKTVQQVYYSSVVDKYFNYLCHRRFIQVLYSLV